MKRRTFLFALGGASLALAAGPPAFASADPAMLTPWTGPYGGIPPFDRVKVAEFPAAFTAAMAAYREDIQAIADNPEPPTFANTLAALEGSGRAFTRVSLMFGVYTSTMNTPEVQAIEREWSPRFAALYDKIIQNDKLFARIEAVYNAPDKTSWTSEQQRLAWVHHTNFVLAGARLSPAQKKEMAEINQRLAQLYTRFSQNALADEENEMLVLTRPEDLAGLPESLRDAAATTAKEKGQAGKWVILNTRSAMESFLTYSDRRDLREKGFNMWIRRGDGGGEHDNNAVVTEILQLRARKAKLLGYETFAHWRLQNTMAKTPENAMKLMMQVWPAAVARVKEEVAAMQELAGHSIEPWDYRYYAEKVRKAKYDLDEGEIKPYLQLDNMREAIFWASGQLYGFTYRKVEGLPTVHADITVYEVLGPDGKHKGLWYFDPYAKTGKQSGAWMNEYRTQEAFQKPITPIVSNNSNFLKAPAGQPVLLSWDDADTMFHEFGHALHGLASRVSYPTLAGTNVARDFVEFPSQINERWLSTPEVLGKFALHEKTGKPMPPELVAKIKRADTFNQGFSTVEALASAILDMKLHLSGEVKIDPREFEKVALAELGMPKEIVMRHRIPHFGHVFSSDGYAAGYYSYIWSDVLTQDAWEAFSESGGPWDKKTANRFYECILQVGNTLDLAQAYRNFRGRDPSVSALLKSRGFL